MNGSLSNEQKFIRNLTEKILANLNNNEFGIKELTRELGVSHTSLNRKLHKLLNKSSNQFIREVRLQKALEMLRNEELTAAEVAFKVGFSSPAYFNTCFHEYFGFSPGKAKSENIDLSIADPVTHFTSKLNQNRIKKLTPFYYKVSFYVFLGFILVSSFFVFQKFFKTKTLDDLISSDGRISVAVLPFQNNTNDSLLDIWQDGIQEILIDPLSKTEGVVVKQSPLIQGYLKSKGLNSYASITPSVASTISKKLDVRFLIKGGFTPEGSILRLYAQLIDSKKGEVIRSFKINGNSDKIMQTADSLSKMISNYLLISFLGKKESPVILASWHSATNLPDAFRYQLYGFDAYAIGDLRTAENWFLKSLEIDSAFFMPALMLAGIYWGRDMFDKSKYWCQKVYNKRAQLNIIDQLRINFMYSKCFGTDFEAIKYLKQITEQDKNDVFDLYGLGLNYSYVFQYNNAIPILERNLEIYDEWDSKPYSVRDYTLLGKAYHETRQYRKEKKLYKKAEQNFPSNAGIIYRQAVLSLTKKDTTQANRYIDKYISIAKDKSVSEPIITTYLAWIYTEADDLDKAEVFLRKAHFLEPNTPVRQQTLAYFLIDKDRNINEGLQLADTLLKINPDSYNYLHTKGWGLYKQGKYEEALKILQKSWEIRREKAVYNHEAYLHLESAKNAVAGMR
jgi:AraC-like DNA-binding protein/TolB-like protein